MTDRYSAETLAALLRFAGAEVNEEEAAEHEGELRRLADLNERVSKLDLRGPIPLGRPWEPDWARF